MCIPTDPFCWLLDVIEYLISIISPEAVNIQNEQGNTALHWAATNGHAKAVEYLITKGKADYKVNQDPRLESATNDRGRNSRKTMDATEGRPRTIGNSCSYHVSMFVCTILAQERCRPHCHVGSRDP